MCLCVCVCVCVCVRVFELYVCVSFFTQEHDRVESCAHAHSFRARGSFFGG